MMEYPFKDLLPLDEVLEREGYYKDWTHLDPEVFYSLTQISEYIKTKGFGVDVRLLIAQLAEHFGLKTTQVVDLGNLIQAEHGTLKQQVQQAVAQVNADRNALETQFNQSVAQMEADKDAVISNATVDSEVILARGGKPTLGARLDETTAQLAHIATVDVSNFPTQTPETDDTARINRAISSITSGDVLVPKGLYNISGNGILIPPNINLKMSTEAEFVYSGSGVCLKFEGGRNGNHTVGKIRKSSLGWKTTDTSSVGVEIKNVNHSVFTILYVRNFYEGIKLSANGNGSGVNTGGGTAYNTITLGQITDNKLGLSFKQTNFGWVNGNTFMGGAVRINSNNAGITGSMLIDMSQTGNGNVFTGVNLEGSSQEKTVVISASNNTFINCRFEANPIESFHLLPSAINNQIIGGYDNFGHKSKIFKDEGQANFILGGRGIKLYGDNGTYGGEALALQGLVSNLDTMLLVQNFQKKNFIRVASNGIFSFFGPKGEKDDTINPTGYVNPVIRINPSNFSIETSNQAGDVAPTPLFEVYTTDRVQVKKQLHFAGGRISSDIISFTQNAAFPDVSKSNKFLTNSTVATTILGFGGSAVGQEILIVGNDTLTTIKNSTAVALKGGVDLTLKENDTISLMRLVSDVWIELHRNII